MKKIGFFTRKGGVGKTTLCVQMAMVMARLGYKMLVIDMDGQVNAQTTLGIRDSEKSIFHLLDYRYPARLDEVLIKVAENLDLITNTNYDAIDADLHRASRIDNFLEKKLRELNEMNYDFVFIDCSPTQTKLNQAIMYYCNEVLVPVTLEGLALEGAASIFSFLDELEVSKEKVRYIVPNMYDPRSINSKDNLKIVYDFFSTYPHITISEPVCRRVKINEANEKSICVQDYDEESFSQILKAVKVVVENESRAS